MFLKITQISVLILLATGLFLNKATAQVGIGTTTPAEGVMLDIESSAAGILIPRVALTSTAVQAPVVTVGSLEAGTLIFNTATTGTGSTAVRPGFYYWDGTSTWIAVSPTASDDWTTAGNSGTTPGTAAGENFLGTTDAQNLIIATDAAERMRVFSDGRISVNNTTPVANTRFQSTGEDGETALRGLSSTTGSGVRATNTGTGYGVLAFSSSTGVGVQGQNSDTGIAVTGINTGTGTGGYFQGAGSSSALRGVNTNTGYGVSSLNSGTGNGIYNQTTNGIGIVNFVGGSNVGVYSNLTNAGGTGNYVSMGTQDGTGLFVLGADNATTPTAGGDVYGVFSQVRTQSPTAGNTVFGAAFVGDQTGVGHGILINHLGSAGRNAEFNIESTTNTSPTIFATHQGEGSTMQLQNQKNSASNTITVADISYTGSGNRNHIAVSGTSVPQSNRGIGIRGSGGQYGVYSAGDFTATGTKAFSMDHPEDPANKILKHFSIESNEVLNVYRGVVQFDSNGKAKVSLPDYYHAINRNPSYQLTAIGASMPDLYISKEINNGSFTIAGGVANAKVSWTVTAERNDPYLKQNPERRNVIIEKEGDERGKYLTPELYNQPKEKGMYYSKNEVQNAQPAKVQRTKATTVAVERLEESQVKPATDITVTPADQKK